MTRRLKFTREGFAQRVAMSKEFALFVVVEGKVVDPYFADKLCKASAGVSNAGYEIVPISHVESASGSYAGGKQAVLAYYDYCKSVSKLSQTNSAGLRTIAFLIDRDAQQLTGGKRRSKHVIYTFYADAEAHVFFESDEVAALSLAGSLDEDSASDLVAALGDWRTDLAATWRPWIELCCVAAAANSSSPQVGFGKLRSLIHDGPRFRTLNVARLSAAQTAVETSSPLSATDFQTVQKSVITKIDRLYRSGHGSTLLKGKWLPQQLAFLVEDYFAGPRGERFEWDSDGFTRSVTRCYMSAMDVTGPGALSICSKLARLV